jgi:hypothetical protein
MTVHDTHRPPPEGEEAHEHADVSVRGILVTAAGLLIVALVVQVAMAGLFDLLDRRADGRDEPLTVVTEPGVRPEPQPRLQTNPSQELKTLREQQRQRLYGYGWVDVANGVVHIPIDVAMKIMLERGYPVRSDATLSPSARPLGSSSGRFAEEPQP